MSASAWLERHWMERVERCRHAAGTCDAVADHQLVLVIAQLDVPALVRDLVALCAALPSDRRQPWAANFTKCVILAGQPRKIATTFAEDVTSLGASHAWLGPWPGRRLEQARRLLRPLRTVPVAAFHDCEVTPDRPTPGRRLAIELVAGELAAEDVLVTLIHTISELVLFGELDIGSELRLRFSRQLVEPSAAALYARISRGPHDLNAYDLRSVVTACS